MGSAVVEHPRQSTSAAFTESSVEGSSVVGRELRDAREALSISVSEMANALCIRGAYIEALEEGRFNDLPGRPYALGFTRSVATYVGLDPDAIALRLRDEVMGVAKPVELVFPESTEDKRLSRAGWIAISLALIAVAYGGWLALGSGHRGSEPPEFSAANSVRVPPPEAVVAAPTVPSADEDVEDRTPETTLAVEPAAEPVPPAAPVAPAVSAPPPSRPVATPTTPVVVATKPSAAPAPALPKAEPPVTSAPVAKPTPAPAAATAPPPTAASSPATAASAPSVATTPASADDSAEDEADMTPEPTSTAVAPATAAPPSGRIVVHATQDSWVQIQSSDGVTVMARTLKAGDSYAVPDRSGLRLTTGNAGALQIVVDGQVAPGIGQVGAVRRNVVLDARLLKAGQALE